MDFPLSRVSSCPLKGIGLNNCILIELFAPQTSPEGSCLNIIVCLHHFSQLMMTDGDGCIVTAPITVRKVNIKSYLKGHLLDMLVRLQSVCVDVHAGGDVTVLSP